MHACCLVILPREAEGEEVKWVDELMAPHSEEVSEDGWWDGYRIGGRWDGYYLGLDKYDESTHYTEAWEQLSRNSAPANLAGEWDTFAVLSVEGFREKEMRNPTWGGQHTDDDPYFIPTPDYAQWRAEQLVKHRDGVVVVVDYHS